MSGAEYAVEEIAKRIDPDDISFDVITIRFDSSSPKTEKIGNVTVHRIGWGKTKPTMDELVKFPMYLNKVMYPLLAMFKAISLHREKPIDAFWCLMTYMGFPAVLFRMFYKKVPFILNLQDGDPFTFITDRKRIKIVSPLLKKIFRDAAMVQPLSSYLGDFARQMGYQGDIVVIPNAVDTKKFSKKPSDDELNMVQERIGKTDDNVYLMTTSRLVHKNAHDDVIRAIEKLGEKYHYFIIGSGPDEEKLKALTRELHVEDRIHFNGFMPLAEIPVYLHACDIFIRPSRTEGFGVSFVEAMAAGIPIIATQEGGLKDFFFDRARDPDKKSTGWAVDPDSPDQIVKAVKTIAINPEHTKETIGNALAMVREQYDWDLIAKNMREKVLGKVLTK